MRIKRSVNADLNRIKILKSAKGYYGSKSKLVRVARQAVMKSGNYAYTSRRLKKRDFRRLWNVRINAEARVNGLSYSNLIHGLKLANIELNRKVLAELAVSDKNAFAKVCESAKAALAK